MGRKLKFGIGGIIFLGVNGVTIYFLDSNFKFLKSLTGGGGGSSLRSRRSAEGENFHLNFDTRNSQETLPNLHLQPDPLGSPDLKLDIGDGKNTLSLSEDTIFKKLIDKDIFNSVNSIYDEIFKESGVTDLERQIVTKYQDLIKRKLETYGQKHELVLKDFEDAKAIIKRCRSNPNQQNCVLTVNQRIALQKFYTLYYDLINESKDVSERLIQVARESGKDLPLAFPLRQLPPDPKTLTKPLNAVGWDKSTFGQNRRPEQWNLLKPFFEGGGGDENLDKYLEKKKQREDAIQAQLRKVKAEAGNIGYWRAQESQRKEIQRLNKELQNSSSGIQIKIGNQFVTWMGQN